MLDVLEAQKRRPAMTPEAMKQTFVKRHGAHDKR
jgi:hypothetical protein